MPRSPPHPYNVARGLKVPSHPFSCSARSEACVSLRHTHLGARETLMTYTFSGAFDRNYGFHSAASRRDRIARIDALATLLDTAFILPGTNVRFGLDAIIGLVP